MKLKSLFTMTAVAAALFLGLTSCNNDKNELTPAAEALAGTYNGTLSITVMGSESTDEVNYIIKEIDDTHVSMTIPAAGSGSMSLPSLTVEDIPVTTTKVSNVQTTTGTLASASGTITVSGEEKAYTFTDITIVGLSDKITIKYSLQYGKMPMAMTCSFTGNK